MLEVVNPGDARKSLAFLRYNGQLISVDPLPNLAEAPACTYAASILEVSLGGAYGAGHTLTERDFAVIGAEMMQRLTRASSIEWPKGSSRWKTFPAHSAA